MTSTGVRPKLGKCRQKCTALVVTRGGPRCGPSSAKSGLNRPKVDQICPQSTNIGNKSRMLAEVGQELPRLADLGQIRPNLATLGKFRPTFGQSSVDQVRPELGQIWAPGATFRHLLRNSWTAPKLAKFAGGSFPRRVARTCFPNFRGTEVSLCHDRALQGHWHRTTPEACHTRKLPPGAPTMSPAPAAKSGPNWPRGRGISAQGWQR